MDASHDTNEPNLPATSVTRLLGEVAGGNSSAADELLPLVYDQLRAVAQQRMGAERPGHTLQATALVHEAFLRLVGPRELPWHSQGQTGMSGRRARTPKGDHPSGHQTEQCDGYHFR